MVEGGADDAVLSSKIGKRRAVQVQFSKGGIGLSVGVKGLRVGAGPRGHYIHSGRGGIYYRSSLGRVGGQQPTAPSSETPPVSSPRTSPSSKDVEMMDIVSSDTMAMKDATVTELLDDLNAKQRRISLAKSLGMLGLMLSLGPIYILGAGGLLALAIAPIGWGIGKWLDSYRRTAVLFYELETDAHRQYDQVTEAFDQLAGCTMKWRHEARGEVESLKMRKQNAGASHLIRRTKITLTYALPQIIRSNITPPAIAAGHRTLYFMPDVLLIEDKRSFGAIKYDNLGAEVSDSRFIEDGTVPRDSLVIGHTWKHPNRSGGIVSSGVV